MSEGPECQQKHEQYTAYTITDSRPSYTIKFSNADGEEVGVLDFNGPGLSFEGNAEESAIVFMTWVGKMFSKRLDEEYKRGKADGRKQ
jgi:hypothetical protein